MAAALALAPPGDWTWVVFTAFHAAAILGMAVRSRQLVVAQRAVLDRLERPATSWKSRIKFCSVALAIAASAALAYAWATMIGEQPLASPYAVSALLQLFSSACALRLHQVHHARSLHASDPLLMYWLFAAILSLVALRSGIKYADEHSNPAALAAHIAYLVSAALSLSMELATCPPPRQHFVLDDGADGDSPASPNIKRYENPLEDANIFSRLTFSWVTPAINDGYRRQSRSMDDLYALPKELAGEEPGSKFFDVWSNERSKAYPSLLRALFRGTRKDIAVSGMFFLIATASQLVQPLLLKQVIAFFQQHGAAEGASLEHGIMLALAMGTLAMVRALTYQAYWYVLMRPYLYLVKILSALVYRKALLMSSESRSSHTTGEIVSYLSVDADKVAVAINFIHYTWNYPLQLCVIIYMLYKTLGWSSLSGVALLVLSTLISMRFASHLGEHNKQFMEQRDQRMRVVTEAMGQMKGIKLYAWERAFIDKIDGIRVRSELLALKRVGICKALMTLVSALAPVLITLVTFGTYVVFDGESRGPLTSQLIFVSLSLFFLLQEPITEGPPIIALFVTAARSYIRLCEFAQSPDLDQDAAGRERYDRDSPSASTDDVLVSVKGGSFKWLSADEPVLKGVTIQCKREELVAVVGRVGAGKSSLVSAILGDMIKESGSVAVRGSIAYVPQQAWIMNATLRDNILFGHRYEEEFYEKVIEACALRPDLEMLPGGDMTEIGEKGINLSGGQKARVSLARAVYARADIYLLDDPLSAVDAHVGKHIFTKVLGPQGLLKTRARILVTNAVQYLPNVDAISMLRDGEIIEQGTFSQVMDNRGEAFNFIHQFLDKDADTTSSKMGSPSLSATQLSDSSDADGGQNISRRGTLGKASANPDSLNGGTTAESNPLHRIIKDEEKVVGSAGWKALSYYLRSGGTRNAIYLVVSAVVSLICTMSSSLWLARWARINDGKQPTTQSDPAYHLLIYGALGVAGVLSASAMSAILWLVCGVNAARTIHWNMLRSVMRSPMSFFDSTPLGRILGLFSSDQAQVDENIPTFIELGLKAFVLLFVSLTLIVISVPLSLVFILPVSLVYDSLQRRFLPTTRDTRRVVNTTRNLSISSTEEAVNGAVSIRAYGRTQGFESMYAGRVETYAMAWWTFLCTNRWLAARLDLLSAGLVCSTTILLICTQYLFGTLDGGYVGLSLTYALSTVGVLNVCIRSSTMLEISLISVERVREYSSLPPEAPEIIEDNRPSESWPDQGAVEFKNYSTRYREGLDLVLSDLSFRVMPKQKVGIVGRTGAGKSSLTLALFRIIEAAGGQILLDGEDISKYGLVDVRSKLSIIPQDPVLFAGTVRENLDPFSSYTDDEIWRALENAHLADVIRSKDERLEFVVTQGGENFSVGQRQLICLARALLKRAKILVLDEATAAIDPESDAIIQESIRKEFKDCTVLTIAHRLNTIIDSDMILVVDSGKLAEYDTPQNLLANENSLFAKLVDEAKAKDASL